MPNYPKTIPDVRDALLAYDPHPVTAEAIAAAQEAASPVVQIVRTFDALKGRIGAIEPPSEGDDPTPVLTSDGLSLLAGCSHLIAANAWHGKGEDALATRDAAVAALTAIEAA